MVRFAPNKMPAAVKRRYFVLIRQGLSGSEAARQVGVSLSCGSLWFIDAGIMIVVERIPISSRYLSQDDRIEIGDGLAAGEAVKRIAVRIGKSFQSVYRELARNRKADGIYQPWFAHNQAHLQRKRPKVRVFEEVPALRRIVAVKLAKRWSPGQISRWLRRRYPNKLTWHVCTETIYDAVYRGLIVVATPASLRTGRTYRHSRRGRGRSKDGSMKQSTKMCSIHERPAHVESRLQAGHWEGDAPVKSLRQSD
ncbi:IS30 family transposase [Cryobacterium sp. TMS1-20-1]|uniref:IS30 family transposase n=1 Tax=Cryobacterium sp. TMS1-20-1 TaxID=1259223 RepID=UPI0018E09A65|nr:IS30 family transposase [Cryobacterium sp. TMS1-20-1]